MKEDATIGRCYDKDRYIIWRGAVLKVETGDEWYMEESGAGIIEIREE